MEVTEGNLLRFPYKKILVAFDGSAEASRALGRGLLLARVERADLTVISVDEHLPRYAPGVGEISEEREVREAYFAELREKVANTARECEATECSIDVDVEGLVGDAGEAIVRFARDGGFDLIVMGHRAHLGLLGRLFGSTEAHVVDEAPCDLLVVR